MLIKEKTSDIQIKTDSQFAERLHILLDQAGISPKFRLKALAELAQVTPGGARRWIEWTDKDTPPRPPKESRLIKIIETLLPSIPGQVDCDEIKIWLLHDAGDPFHLNQPEAKNTTPNGVTGVDSNTVQKTKMAPAIELDHVTKGLLYIAVHEQAKAQNISLLKDVSNPAMGALYEKMAVFIRDKENDLKRQLNPKELQAAEVKALIDSLLLLAKNNLL